MTPTCLGSPGAARAMRAAVRADSGYRLWMGKSCLRCGRIWDRNESWVGWELATPMGWQWIDRETARLILRGLLAEGVARELTEWVEAHRPHSAPQRRSGKTMALVFEMVLAKLRELGVTK